MLDGLELKEKLFSDITKNKDFRYDSQFYTKEPIKNNSLKYDKINNILIKSQYGISISMNEDKVGYPIYRMNEIHNMMCDLDVSKYANITKSELETFVLNDKDVVFNRTNSFEWVGRTGLYRKLNKNDYVFASYLVRFIPNENIILSEYLTTFLNCKYGQWDIKRRARQSINQTNVNPEEVKAMDIPILDMNIQNKIKDLFETSHNSKVTSASLYKEAEQLLLKELDLLDFKPSKEKIAIKTFSESFGESGRLDSEYYQPKYDEIIEKIKEYRGGYKSIREILTEDIKSGTTPKTIIKEHIPNSNYFLRAEAFNNDLTLNYNSLYSMDNETFIKHNSISIKQFDILVSMTGTIGSVAIVTKDINAIINQNIVKLSVNNELINYNIFALYMTTIGRILLTREQTGNVQPYVNIPNFSNLIVPIIKNTIQTKIEEKIRESFKLKEESKQLLEVAKRAVEIAIEANEEKAIKYIRRI